jgi:signal transduction histidine kinase
MPWSKQLRRAVLTARPGAIGWLAVRLRSANRRLAGASAAAEAAARRRQQLLAGAAHDLKSPLAGISMNAQLARRRLERSGTDDALATQLGCQLADIEWSVGRMATVLEDVLDVARIQAGERLRLNREPTRLLPAVEAAVAAHEPNAPRHTLRMIALADPVGTWDEARLARVVDNLLSSAIKYSPSGGEITLEIAEDESADGQQFALLRVSDRGVGITAADLDQVVERFFGTGTSSRRIAGSGIRLASAWQIVEHHGGTLTAKPREGGGSTLTVRLPV